MEQTMKDLAAAFAGESQANRKYLAYALQADKEGFPQAAKLFRAAAEAETIHAHAHLRTMGKIKTTLENLQDAVNGETYEFSEMYPAFIKDAEAEGATQALRSFKLANEAEQVHAELYQKALANLNSEIAIDLYVCTVCGHIAEGSAPDTCPICKAKAQAYKKVD